MTTATDSRVAEIREKFNALARALSEDAAELVERLPEEAGEAWDDLLKAIEDAEGER